MAKRIYAKDEITPVRCAIILALADNRMKLTHAAKALGMNHTNIIYHSKLIKAITGKNPMNFYDLIDLVELAKERLEYYGEL